MKLNSMEREFNAILIMTTLNFLAGTHSSTFIILIQLFCRNSNDYTHIYGPKLIPIIRSNVNAQAGILDGEIIVLNKITGETVPFGMNKTVAMEDDEGEENDFQLCCTRTIFSTANLMN